MGHVDLFHSRRTNYAECKYWIRSVKDSQDLSEWVLKKKPEGTFYAKEVNNLFNQPNPQGNAIMFDKNVIALETDDDVDNIDRGCVVLYNGKPWTVDNVQRRIHRKESEFSVETHYKTTINIRR